MQVKIIGAGLAGCEAALWLADRGVQVELYEQKPAKYSPAHKSAGFAELICSNSLKAERPDSASGLLKIEMKMMGSHLLNQRFLPSLLKRDEDLAKLASLIRSYFALRSEEHTSELQSR